MGEIQGETLIMLQTFSAKTDGEDERSEEVTASDIWQTIPAVENNRVFVVEHVGFPGEISGRQQLLADYVEIFG